MRGREVEERERGAGRAQHGIADGLFKRLSQDEWVCLLGRDGTWLKVEGVGEVESRRGIFAVVMSMMLMMLLLSMRTSGRGESRRGERVREKKREGKGDADIVEASDGACDPSSGP